MPSELIACFEVWFEDGAWSEPLRCEPEGKREGVSEMREKIDCRWRVLTFVNVAPLGRNVWAFCEAYSQKGESTIGSGSDYNRVKTKGIRCTKARPAPRHPGGHSKNAAGVARLTRST